MIKRIVLIGASIATLGWGPIAAQAEPLRTDTILQAKSGRVVTDSGPVQTSIDGTTLVATTVLSVGTRHKAIRRHAVRMKVGGKAKAANSATKKSGSSIGAGDVNNTPSTKPTTDNGM